MNVASPQSSRRVLGRYALFDEIAAGGMATVHIGRLLGPVGFARTVAIKCLHPHFAKDPEFVSMFVDEARLAARISHPNVVSTLDIVSESGELFLVMEYVAGDSLARLLRAAPDLRAPPPLAIAIVMGALHGLHAAHEATSERGQPLSIVHRDVSPQNILVGSDGVSRVLDFGIAKAASRLQTTREGQLKGKLGYMAPEQLDGDEVDRRTDVYAAGVVLWEALTGRRLFQGKDGAPILNSSHRVDVGPASAAADGVPGVLDPVLQKALAFRREDRFATAKDMAIALEETGLAASQREVGEWVERTAHLALAQRTSVIADLDQRSTHEAEYESGNVLGHGPGHGPSHGSGRLSGRVLGTAADDERGHGGNGVGAPPGSGSRRELQEVPTVAYQAAVGETSGIVSRNAGSVTSRMQGGTRSARGQQRAAIAVGVGGVVALLLAWGLATQLGESSAAQAPIIVHGSSIEAAEARSAELASPPIPSKGAAEAPPAANAAGVTPAAVASPGGSAVDIARARTTKVRRGGPRAGSCNPPYVIDVDGVRVPKRHCL